MPLYQYQCEVCDYTEDHLQKISDEPITECPKCSSARYHKVIGTSSFDLKGGGWYKSGMSAK